MKLDHKERVDGQGVMGMGGYYYVARRRRRGRA